ncbi:type I restriction enzyme, S subunit [Staphylococcus cohnii]
MEFKKYKLGEFIEYRNEKLLIENVNLENYISTENLLPDRGGKQTADKLPNAKSVKKYDEKDVLISNIRPYFKKIWQAEFPGGASNDVLILNSYNNNISNDYLYYYLSQDKFFDYMTQTAKGTKMPRGDKKAILDYEIKVPNIKEVQNYIVNLGKFIDQKIEVNQKIIANLEELSQTLFKRWFVDFEFPDENGNPYKSSGGEMVDSELGEMPRGWAIGHFNQFCKKPIAGDWGKEHQQGNYNKPVRIIRGADINDYSKGGKGKSPIRFILEKNFDNKKLMSGDIIVEISGGSPTQSTGRTLLINKEILQNSNYGLVCTNFCKVIRPVDEKYGEWIAYYFNYLYFRDVFFNYENGTTGIKNLDYKSILNTMKIIVPSTQILNNFHNLISKYKINIQYLGMENDYLTQLRDTLLPKLMSGEIEIPTDIEVNEDEFSI